MHKIRHSQSIPRLSDPKLSLYLKNAFSIRCAHNKKNKTNAKKIAGGTHFALKMWWSSQSARVEGAAPPVVATSVAASGIHQRGISRRRVSRSLYKHVCWDCMQCGRPILNPWRHASAPHPRRRRRSRHCRPREEACCPLSFVHYAIN
jgi:hypothetical protein